MARGQRPTPDATELPPTEKICKYCDKTKPLHMFRKGKLYKHGYMNQCSSCHADEMRKRRQRPDVKAREKAEQSSEEGRRKTRDRMRLYRERKILDQSATIGRGAYTKKELQEVREKSRTRSLEFYHSEQGQKAREIYKKSGRQNEVARKHRQTSKGKAGKRRYKQKYPEKIDAGTAVHRAIKAGKLIRPDVCSTPDENCCGRIEAHHEDHSKQLDVVWLCKYHHEKKKTEAKD